MSEMKIAANLADLTRYDDIPRQCLIAPVVTSREIVRTGTGRIDDAAVVLECDATRAKAIIDLLRSYDAKAKRYRLRAYQQGPRGGWTVLR